MHLLNQVRQLSVEEQLELLGALWDNTIEWDAVPPLVDAQKVKLDRRLAT